MWDLDTQARVGTWARFLKLSFSFHFLYKMIIVLYRLGKTRGRLIQTQTQRNYSLFVQANETTAQIKAKSDGRCLKFSAPSRGGKGLYMEACNEDPPNCIGVETSLWCRF
jgi:hypothetical protein